MSSPQPDYPLLLVWVHRMMLPDAQAATGVPPSAYRSGYLDALRLVEHTLELIMRGDEPPVLTRPPDARSSTP